VVSGLGVIICQVSCVILTLKYKKISLPILLKLQRVDSFIYNQNKLMYQKLNYWYLMLLTGKLVSLLEDI
jgi:hypothetical protein